ncbi:hypothetical protein OIU76_026824 [Salix suchowensis]|uniref:CASP-like protein n=1 Tax=Salix suchowensis TaxID=1278906 RepID=A0ABQ9AS91_9ROSI|nr:CASP protein [Salix suchowensis]KAJ6355409.1 hypothetical protein OIU77_005904 [Salix suchowensis]KAJ6372405.1 hypothetical protein OIU76_026824 [Salix suchowensis]
MALEIAKVEAILRGFAILLLVSTACLVGLDSQTKFVIFYEKEVTYRDLRALLVLVCVDAGAAAYNLLQLISRWFLSAWISKGNLKGSYRFLSWGCCLLDQLAAYITFAVHSAALEHSVLVITGAEVFQWMKWCNRFTRFCFQIGGALTCGYTASVLMAMISFISAFNLFRLYSPKIFLRLKGT